MRRIKTEWCGQDFVVGKKNEKIIRENNRCFCLRFSFARPISDDFFKAD